MGNGPVRCSAKPLSTPNTQDIEDQIRVLCIWMLACADYAAAEATLAAVAWSQVASRVTPQHLLSAIWPHLLQSLSAAEDVDSLRADASNEDVDMYTRALSVRSDTFSGCVLTWLYSTAGQDRLL